MARRSHIASWFLFGLAGMFLGRFTLEVMFGVSLSRFSFGRAVDPAHAAEQFMLPLALAGAALIVRAVENRWAKNEDHESISRRR